MTEFRSQISAADLQKLRQKINELILQEKQPFIHQAMHPSCRVAVLLPAYDESVKTLLRPLLSLARQEKAAKEEFEVVVIANNNKKEALDLSPAYLLNQRVLEFLRFLEDGKSAGEGKINAPDFTAEENSAIEEIKQSGLRIVIIDKSSADLADDINYLANARNRACLEIARRFLDNGRNENGIVAVTDCDCRVSPNYIRSIIDTFKEHEFLNGLCGGIEHEIDESLPYYQAVKRAFDAHVGFTGRLSPAKKYSGGLALKKFHKINFVPLNTGQDLAVRLRAWFLTGGWPDRPSGEDHHFGRLVESLPGDIAFTDSYTVYPLTRISERTGLAADGRRVLKIAEAVKNYYEHKSDRVMIPDRFRQKKLFDALSKEAFNQTLDKEKVLELFIEHGREPGGLSPEICGQLAAIMNGEMAKPAGERDYAKMENFIMENFDGFLPVKDVTSLIRE
jgi:hypothetical protein